MDPLTLLALTAGAIEIADRLVAEVERRKRDGDISAAEQLPVREMYLALRARGDAAFQGPEFEPSPVASDGPSMFIPPPKPTPSPTVGPPLPTIAPQTT
jgi:hypothetical protein